VEGHSTVEDQRPRNSYQRVCYVFVAQAASECHWNWTAMGDDQRPTEGDSRLRGTREPDRQATLGTRGEMTSQNLWSRYVHHFVGITWHNVWLMGSDKS